MISKRQDGFLRTLDTENLLNGFRGEEGGTPLQQALLKDALHILEVAQKKDARTWFLRHLKASYLQQSEQEGIPLSKKEQKFFNTRVNSQGTPFDTVTPSRVIEALDHFVRDSEISAIENYQYEQQNWLEMYYDFQDFERSFLELKEREVTPDWSKETVLKDYGDFVFVDLGVSGSRIEGNSMGHCGNGSGESHQRVFSLRQKLPNGNLMPRATLIGNQCKFDENGQVTSCSLGEIKGYGNQKVSAKYRPFIAEAMLELGIFKDKINGAYLPEVDLSLLDFERGTALEIAKKLPSYANPFEAAALTDYQGGEILDRAIQNHYAHNPDEKILVGGDNILANLDDLLPSGVRQSADLTQFMDFQTDPHEHVLSTLPQDLQTELMMFSIIEGMDMRSFDVQAHLTGSSALSVFYKGMVKTYIDEQSNKQSDEVAAFLGEKLGVDISVTETGSVQAHKSFSETVIGLAKGLANRAEGNNPMNNPETYKHLEKGTFNDGKLSVIGRAKNQFIDEAQAHPEIQERLAGLKLESFANEQSLTMMKTTVQAMNAMLQHQMKDHGVAPNHDITRKGNIIAESDKVEFVTMPFADLVSQASKIGVDLHDLRNSTSRSLSWMGTDSPVSEEVSFAIIREKTDGVMSKNVGVAVMHNDHMGSHILNVATAHGIDPLETGLSHSIVEAITAEKEMTFHANANIWRHEDKTFVANLPITAKTEQVMLDGIEPSDNLRTPPLFLFGTREGVVQEMVVSGKLNSTLTHFDVNAPVTSEPPALEVVDLKHFFAQPSYVRESYDADGIKSYEHDKMQANFEFLKGRVDNTIRQTENMSRLGMVINKGLEDRNLADHRLTGVPEVNGRDLREYVLEVLGNYSYSEFAQDLAKIGSKHLEKNCEKYGIELVEHSEYDFKWLLKEDYSFFSKASAYKTKSVFDISSQIEGVVHDNIVKNSKYLDQSELDGVVMKKIVDSVAKDIIARENKHDDFASKLFGALNTDAEKEKEKQERIQKRISKMRDVPF